MQNYTFIYLYNRGRAKILHEIRNIYSFLRIIAFYVLKFLYRCKYRQYFCNLQEFAKLSFEQDKF